MHDLYSKRAFLSSREAPPQYLGTAARDRNSNKKHVMSMKAHARENVASWLRQDQLLKHNVPSTKNISFLDPLLVQSDNTTQHSTGQYNTGLTQTRHTSILMPPAHTPKCFARIALYKRKRKNLQSCREKRKNYGAAVHQACLLNIYIYIYISAAPRSEVAGRAE